MQQVLVPAISAVVNGVPINVPDTWVQLRDQATFYNGPGSYHIQLKISSSFASPYLVTYGLRPCDTDSLMTVARCVVTPNGKVLKKDTRPLNVTIEAVNSTIAPVVFTDGSFLETGVVTTRTIAGGVIGGAGGLLDEIGATEGDVLYRGASSWLALAPGTAGQFLTTGGSGAAPSWTTGGGGGGTVVVPEGTSFPGSPTTWQLFWRTDLSALFVYNGAAWLSADTLAQLNDVTLTSPATNDLLAYNGSKWVNKTLSAEIDAAIGSTRGAILERGSSGWQLITPGSTGLVLTSQGTGQDPQWAAGGGSGGGGVYISYDAMVEIDHPLLYFPLNDASGSATDLIRGITWAPTGTMTYHTASLLFDGSLSTTFPSTSNFFSSPIGMAVSSGTGSANWAFEAWIKYPSLPSVQSNLFWQDPSGTNGFLLYVVASTGVLHVLVSGSADHATVTLSASTIYHVVLVYQTSLASSTTWYLYVNGSVVATGTDNPSGGGASTFMIGGASGKGGGGLIMQKAAYYYGFVPSGPRIGAHYTGGTTGLYN